MQKTIPKFHKSIPNFALHSTHSYKNLFKNYPKNVCKLDLDSTTISSLKPDQTKRVLQDLIKLRKKCRNIKALQDVNLLKYFKVKKSQAILIMKKFHRVESLDVQWDFYDLTIQKETRTWLKYINKPSWLFFRHVNNRTAPQLSRITSSKNFNMKLLKDIQQRKIRRLMHSVANKGNFYILNMRDYPSTIQELSLNLAHSVIDFGDNIEKLISMKKFSVLKRLELPFLELKMTFVLLRSIPNPQLLSSLGLSLRNRFPEDDKQSMIPIFEFLRDKCGGLDKLDLKITHPTEKFGILSLLRSQLRVLNLWVSVKIERHLQDIELLLLNVKNLEKLDLMIDFDLNAVLCKENFEEFYQALGQLTQLKKLCLNFSPKEDINIRSAYYQYFNIPRSSYSSLMRSISSLNRLEELCLRIPAPESGEALNGLAHRLKKFEVDFYEEKVDVEGFVDVLRKMTELRELSLSRFSFEKDRNFLDFKEILKKGFKNLEKIVLEQFKIPGEEDEILVDLVFSMLSKKGLKELRVKQNFQEKVGKEKATIDFTEILKKNPELRSVKIESQAVAYYWFYNPLESFKYV